MPKLTVYRIERHTQPVEVEVDDSLPREEQIRQARQLVADGWGEEVGEIEYHSTDQSSENWSVEDGDTQIG